VRGAECVAYQFENYFRNIQVTETAQVIEMLSPQFKDGCYKVKSREKGALEFKQDFNENCLRKCLKTIAAFSNCGGGKIEFGVTDSPRILCGTQGDIDEAEIQNLLLKHLHPIPDTEISEHDVHGFRLVVMDVASAARPPVLAVSECQTIGEKKSSTVLNPGVVYFRRAGQTRPATGIEFSSLLEKRDQSVRQSILGLIARAGDVGFDNVAIADFRNSNAGSDAVTLWVSEDTAKDLKIIDKGRLVQSAGAPAYEIRGAIQSIVPRDRDPRKPLLPAQAVRVLRPAIHKIFGASFPWAERHLNTVAKHLGFWNDNTGDKLNVETDSVTRRPMYYEAGRSAIEKFATRDPDAFVDVVGSRPTKTAWRQKKKMEPEVSVEAKAPTSL